jgi:hypothetical protein
MSTDHQLRHRHRIPPLWGRALRFVLVNEMMAAGGPVTVAELVRFIDHAGFPIEGRASKVISDALRWEVRRGRVVRLARGVYRYRTAPRSTARRIRRFARISHRWLADVGQGRTPPPTPPDTRLPAWRGASFPDAAPWWSTGWLWGS